MKDININNLAMLRVFALGLVVLRHSFAPFIGAWNLPVSYEVSEIASVIGNYISTISMPLYVFISGLLFSYLRNNLNKYPTFRILLQKKVRRLIIPYLFLAPVYIYFYSEFETIGDFLIIFLQGAGHLWFLLMIFFVFILFYLLETFFKRFPIKSFFVIAFLFFLFPGFYYIQLDPLAKVLQYFPYFYFGYFFYYKNNLVFKFLANKKLTMIALHTFIFILSIWLALNIENPLYKSLFKAYVLLPMGLLSISFLFLMFYQIKDSKFSFINRSVKNINHVSYYIYIFHQPLLMTLFSLSFLQNWPPIMVIVSSFISVFLSSLAMGNIMMKFWFGRKLIGSN